MEPICQDDIVEKRSEQRHVNDIEQSPSSSNDKCTIDVRQDAVCVNSICSSVDCRENRVPVDSSKVVDKENVDSGKVIDKDNVNNDGSNVLTNEIKSALPVQSKETDNFNEFSSTNSSFDNYNLIVVNDSVSDKALSIENVVKDSIQSRHDNPVDTLIDKSIGISMEDDLKILQNLNDRDNYLYEKTFISNELNFKRSSIEAIGITTSDFIDMTNKNLNNKTEDRKGESDVDHRKINVNSTKETEQIDAINKLQNMTWLKSPSNLNITTINPYSKLTLKSLPNKQDSVESYYECTRRNFSKQRQNKKQNTVNTEEQSSVIKEQIDDTWDDNSTVHSMDISRKKEDEQLKLVLAESIKTAQEENQKYAILQAPVKVQIHDNEDWYIISNNQNSDDKPCHKAGTVDDCTEKNMNIGKEARQREQEIFNKVSSNNSVQPIDAGRFEYRPDSQDSNSKNKNQDFGQGKQDIHQLNWNSERPIHGRSGKDIDFGLRQGKDQKLEPSNQNLNRSQQIQIYPNKGLENQRTQNPYNQNQNYSSNSSVNIYKNEENSNYKNYSDNYNENNKQVRLTRQSVKNEDSVNKAQGSHHAFQGNLSKDQFYNNKTPGSHNAVQSTVNKDQFYNNRVPNCCNVVPENSYWHDKNQSYPRYQYNMNRNDHSNRNQNYSRNQESNNNQSLYDKNKDMTFKNRDQNRNQNNSDKNNQDTKPTPRYKILVNRRETKNTIVHLEESWDDELLNKKVVKNSVKETKEKIQESAQSSIDISAKKEPKNAVDSQNKRRGSNSSLNQEVAAVSKEIKADTISSLDQTKSIVSSQDEKHESNNLLKTDNGPQVITSTGQVQSSINQSTNVGLKPNVVMAIEGNQNIQRVLGMDPSTCVSFNTSTEVSISTASNSSLQSLFVTTQAAQNACQTQSISNTNYSLPGVFRHSPVNINAQPFQQPNYTQIQDLNNQNSTQASPAITGYFPANSINFSEEEFKIIEMQMIEKMLKESEIVASAKRYLASAEANLFSTQSKLEEFRSRSVNSSSNLLPYLFNNLKMKSQGDSSLSGEVQSIQYSIPPGFSTLPNVQKTNQSETIYVQPNVSYSPLSDYSGEAFPAQFRQIPHRMNVLPNMNLQHRTLYQAIPTHIRSQHKNNSDSIAALGSIPPSNGSRESKTSDNHYYNQ